MGPLSTSTNKVEIPDHLINRPTYKGMPVPYTAPDVEGDVPDFKGVDPVKIAQCLRLRLCGLCGMKMHKEIVFLGGPISGETLYYTFPPMHEDCAEYAARVCPHLAKSKAYADGTDLEDFDRAHSPDPIDEAHMIICTGWQEHPEVGRGVLRAVGYLRRRVFKEGEEQGRLL